MSIDLESMSASVVDFAIIGILVSDLLALKMKIYMIRDFKHSGLFFRLSFLH